MYNAVELVHWMQNQDHKILWPAQVDIGLTNLCNLDGYDVEPKARCRLNTPHAELDRLANPTLLEMWTTLKQRLYENWIRFREHKAVDGYLESIRNLLAL